MALETGITSRPKVARLNYYIIYEIEYDWDAQ